MCCCNLFGEEIILDDFQKENAADIAWIKHLSSIPNDSGLSFFYGGMVSQKNILSTMLQSFMALD